MTEQQIADKYGLTAQELTEFNADHKTEIHIIPLKALIQDTVLLAVRRSAALTPAADRLHHAPDRTTPAGL
jgi:hypothetical protein